MDEVIAALIEQGKIQRAEAQAQAEAERQAYDQAYEARKAEDRKVRLEKYLPHIPVVFHPYITEVNPNIARIEVPGLLPFDFDWYGTDKEPGYTMRVGNGYRNASPDTLPSLLAYAKQGWDEKMAQEAERQAEIERANADYAERAAKMEESAKVRQALEAARQNHILATDNMLDYARDVAIQRDRMIEHDAILSIAASLAVIATKMMEHHEYPD